MAYSLDRLIALSKELKTKEALVTICEIIDIKIESLNNLIVSAQNRDEAWDVKTGLKLLKQLKAELINYTNKNDKNETVTED